MNNVICTVCPKGCHLAVDIENNTVTGNLCPRGAAYGIKEVTAPVRTITSTVKIDGALYRRCPVKTVTDVPRELVPRIMRLLDTVTLEAPVALGDKVFENVLGCGVDIVVTKSMPKE